MASGLAARNGGWIGLVALVAVLLLGLGLRLGEAWDGRAPVYDAKAYAAIARNLDEGNGFTVGATASQPSSNYSPGLPLFVAGLYGGAGGVHERLARVVLAVVGAMSVLFAYAIGRRLGRPLQQPRASEVVGVPAPQRSLNKPAYRRDWRNPRMRSGERRTERGKDAGRPNSSAIWPTEDAAPRSVRRRQARAGVSPVPHRRNSSASVWPALVGALVVAVYPALLEYQGMLMSEPLAATVLSGGVLAVLWAWEGRRARWVLPGALFGGLALVRPEYLGVAILVAVVIFAREAKRGWRHSLLDAAVFLAALVVFIAPWTIRNAVALDRFVPISTGGGQVLFAGTYLPSDGDPEKVGREVVAENPHLFAPDAAQHLRLEQILSRLAHSLYPAMASDQALSKMGKEQFWTDITEEPWEYAGFVATKIGRIWSHGPRKVMREPVWEVLHRALVALGLLGLAILAWRRRWEALLLGTIFLAITAISALLVASPRRVLVLVPLLSALASVAIAWIATRLVSSPAYSRANSPIAPEHTSTLGAP